MIINFCTKTDTGKVRRANQDFCGYHVADKYDIAFFVVADGMGGHNAGEIASSVAVCSFIDAAKDFFDVESHEGLERFIKHTIKRANIRVRARAMSDTRFKGMGTTLVTAAVTDSFVLFANVGDSRAYMIRNGVMEQITKDHSYVQYLVDQKKISKEEASSHPRKNEITRALGAEDDVEIDVFLQNYNKGDCILLCSDGLTNMISETQISNIIMDNASVYEAVDKLIDCANNAGGKDNITVILIRL